jgi:hypothetical protein
VRPAHCISPDKSASEGRCAQKIAGWNFAEIGKIKIGSTGGISACAFLLASESRKQIAKRAGLEVEGDSESTSEIK